MKKALQSVADLYLTCSLPRLQNVSVMQDAKRPSSEYPEDLIQLSRFLLLFLQWISWEKDMTILLPLQCRALVLESEPGGNAEKLCEYLNTRFLCIDIADAVKVHLRDIDHPDNIYDVTYENARQGNGHRC